MIVIMLTILNCKAQIYPLTTDTDVPANSYIKDINNDLANFEGTWQGTTWQGNTFMIIFKKIKFYDTHLANNPYYQDLLIGKFRVTDTNGNILFDNLGFIDDNAKIKGVKGYASGAYLLGYLDSDLCDKMGSIIIKFTNITKTELKFKFGEVSNLIDSSCFYHGKPADQRPEPLPKEIILTKQ